MTALGVLCRFWRRNWMELSVTGGLAVLAVAGVLVAAEGKSSEGGGFVFLAVFTWAVMAAGWLIGMHRRHLPMREAVEEIHAGVARMVDTLETETGERPASGPRLSVVRPPGR